MRLYVNIDHVATLREARKTDEPDPVRAADAAERGGADGITVHLREDRRHIQDADVRRLRASIRTVLNLELGAHEEIVRFACRLKPFQATLVPERRQEITTEGGLALQSADRKVGAAIRRLINAGIRVSLFIDPNRRIIERAAELGVPAIELHTGRYARTWRGGDAALRALQRAAGHAKALGLAVHAGHGLTYDNVQPVAAISDIEELNIGHSIVSNAVFWGLEDAVRRMRKLVDEAPSAVSRQQNPNRDC
ncbi:MAG TPA: pyridoxine 5'-phosphate synthase [Gemmatimonadales bacterium]|nr:pyridoxine 5'-phosphate synthase [Gemmatimonadales bacterium]